MGLACEIMEQHGCIVSGRADQVLGPTTFSLTKHFPSYSSAADEGLVLAETHPAQCMTLHDLGLGHSANSLANSLVNSLV